MIRPGLLPHTITIITGAAATDDYGNTVLDYGDDAERRDVKAYVRPTTTSVRPAGDEYVDAGRDIVEMAWQVHTNDLDVGPLDRVEYDGEVYEVDGKPLIWKTLPNGRRGFCKFGLRRVQG
jgi:hypothetical protein